MIPTLKFDRELTLIILYFNFTVSNSKPDWFNANDTPNLLQEISAKVSNLKDYAK
jgi:hypothetical protein